jgi:hypothetical protein
VSDCCGPASCCGAPVEDYPYGPQPYVDGSVPTLFAEVPRVRTELTAEDRRGTLRVRLGFGRNDYRVQPGLYAVGQPDDRSPVLVTANYKLSFDALRGELTGRDAWLLVLDTRGVNVWCAAGKGTFGTDELVRRVRDTGLENIVGHFTLVLPQLGAPGVAAHEVRSATGFRVVYGPVRASDLPAFLDAGLRATSEMRRVDFGPGDRLVVAAMELSVLRDPRVIAGAGVLVLAAILGLVQWFVVASIIAAGVAAVLSGALIVPLALPWIPGRMFALKGAIVGGVVALALLALAGETLDLAGSLAVVLGVSAIASYTAMNYTGSSTFTSLSGVLWEMRRAVPFQLVAGAFAVVALVASAAW